VAGIDGLGCRGKNGRGASGGKLLDRRTENANGQGRDGLNRWHRRGHRDIPRGGIHQAVREQGHAALMARLTGVVMEPFVQRWRRGHGIEQEEKTDQQRGNGCLAVRLRMAR